MPMGIGGTFLTEDEAAAGTNIQAAIGGGYKFFEVHLSNKADIQGGRMAGVLVVDTFPDGQDVNGVPRFSFNVRGGYIDFEYDPTKYIRVANPPLLDDEEAGTSGPKGYNRDFIASHWESGIFIIPDKEVEADIKRRAVLLKKIAEEKVYEPPEEPAELDTAIKDLEAHERHLKAEKERLQKIRDGKAYKPSLDDAKKKLEEEIKAKEEAEIKAQKELKMKADKEKKDEILKKALEDSKKKKEVNAEHSHKATD